MLWAERKKLARLSGVPHMKDAPDGPAGANLAHILRTKEAVRELRGFGIETEPALAVGNV
jgi:hypothetical protein